MSCRACLGVGPKCRVMHSSPWSVRLSAIVVSASLAAVASGASGGESDPHEPGDAEFPTMLSAIQSSVGVFKPGFEPANMDYTLTVDDTKATELVLQYDLDLSQYSPQRFPLIYVNGEQHEYDPLGANRVTMKLNENLLPVDKVFTIKVADPSGPSGFWLWKTENQHTYTVRVLQPPETEIIVRPTAIVVKQGHQVLERQFDTKMARHRSSHTYVLTGDEEYVDVQVTCNANATGLKFGGKAVDMNKWHRIRVERARAAVMIECFYQDPVWQPHAQGEPHELEFHKTLDLSEMSVSLRIEAQDGYCAMRAGSGAETEDAAQGMKRNFVCRTGVETPQFVAIASDRRPELVLETHEGKRFHLTRGVAQGIPAPEERQLYKLFVIGGEHDIEYNVEVIPAALCSTLECPSGLFPRPELDLFEAAQRRLCLQENCTDEDVAHCCAKAAACSTLSKCPKGKELRPDAASIVCKTASCNTRDDGEACCGKPAPCSTARKMCGEGRDLRKDVASFYCYGEDCGARDVDTCCEPRASCEEYHFKCPDDARKVNGTSFKCRGGTCTKEDARVCCNVDEAKRLHELELRRKAELEQQRKKEEEEKESQRWEAIGCSPVGGTCAGHPCYYDETCLLTPPRLGGLGCWAAGLNPSCRFCGHGVYPKCPADGSCYSGHCEDWPEEKLQRCLASEGVECPAHASMVMMKKFDSVQSSTGADRGFGIHGARRMLSLLGGGGCIAALVAVVLRVFRINPGARRLQMTEEDRFGPGPGLAMLAADLE